MDTYVEISIAMTGQPDSYEAPVDGSQTSAPGVASCVHRAPLSGAAGCASAHAQPAATSKLLHLQDVCKTFTLMTLLRLIFAGPQ